MVRHSKVYMRALCDRKYIILNFFAPTGRVYAKVVPWLIKTTLKELLRVRTQNLKAKLHYTGYNNEFTIDRYCLSQVRWNFEHYDEVKINNRKMTIKSSSYFISSFLSSTFVNFSNRKKTEN